jgi:Protein of unknown function (DUF3168)
MNDALFAIQQAVAAALGASAEVQGLLGDPVRVYDHVPPGAAFPYAVIGTVAAKPYDDKDRTGFAATIAVDIWSRYRGTREVKDILQAVYDALHRTALSVTGQVFVSCEFAGVTIVPDGDGLTYRGTAHYDIMVQSS